MGKHLASLLALSLFCFAFSGCSLEPDSAKTSNLSGTIMGGEPETDFAPTTGLDSATLYIYVASPSFQTVYVYRALSPWAETTVTQNNFSDSYSSVSYGSFIASSVGWHSIDISDLVYGWINDSFPNYGLVLDQDISTFPQAIYFTRESMFKPYLDIAFPPTFSSPQNRFESDADAFVDGSNPNSTDGSSLAMMTGWADNNSAEYKSLIHFSLPVAQQTEPSGSIGGHIWFDSNSDGLQDPTEIGASRIVVKLRTCDAGYLDITETDINGNYLFDSLPYGDYRVFVDLPAGYTVSPNDLGINDSIDSDFDTLFAHTICYTVDSGNNSTDADCGLVEYVPTIDDGCTQKREYFKKRCGFNHEADIVSALLPIQLGSGDYAFNVDSIHTAYYLLKAHGSGSQWNGIVKLYGELLTAKLNIKRGASDSAISTQLMEIDTFLGSHDRSFWTKLEKKDKKKVKQWKKLLKKYNEGKIGPGSCSELDDSNDEKEDDHKDHEDDDKGHNKHHDDDDDAD